MHLKILAILLPPNAVKGFALLEVLLALLVVSVAFLGTLGMQLSTLHAAEANYLRSIVITQLVSMQDRLRANDSIAGKNRELQYWNAVNARLLPKSKGMYYCAHEICTVKLEWQKQALSLAAHL